MSKYDAKFSLKMEPGDRVRSKQPKPGKAAGLVGEIDGVEWVWNRGRNSILRYKVLFPGHSGFCRVPESELELVDEPKSAFDEAMEKAHTGIAMKEGLEYEIREIFKEFEGEECGGATFEVRERDGYVDLVLGPGSVTGRVVQGRLEGWATNYSLRAFESNLAFRAFVIEVVAEWMAKVPV